MRDLRNFKPDDNDHSKNPNGESDKRKELKRKRDDTEEPRHGELQSLLGVIKPEHTPTIADIAIKILEKFKGTLNSNAESGLQFVTRSNDQKKLAIDEAILKIRSIKEKINTDGINAVEQEIQRMSNVSENNKRVKRGNKEVSTRSFQSDTSDTMAFKAIREAIADLPKEADSLRKENESLKKHLEDLQKEADIDNLVEESMPTDKLTEEAAEAYKKIVHLHRKAKRVNLKTSEKDVNEMLQEHTEAYERLLNELSPETLQGFKGQGIEFVTKLRDSEIFYLTVQKNKEGIRQVELPIPYLYKTAGMVQRAFDMLIEIAQLPNEAEVDMTRSKNNFQTFDANNSPEPEVRAEIGIAAWLSAEMLGPKRGYTINEEHDPLFMKHRRDYKEGIRQAIIDGEITEDTPISDRIKIGRDYVRLKYLERIKPKGDRPKTFPSMQPGAHCEERDEWDLHEEQEPMEFGSQQYDNWMENLMQRKENGDNFTLLVNMLPPDEESRSMENRIVVQPFYIMEDFRTYHGNNARGEDCLFAGEADIDCSNGKKKLLRLKDQSGHYRTFDKNNPDSTIMYVLKQFQDLGYDISETVIELTAFEGPEKVPYRNYQPPSNRENNSMKALKQHWQEQIQSGIDIPWDLRAMGIELPQDLSPMRNEIEVM